MIALMVVVALAACSPPAQSGLTPAQCERFVEAREALEIYIADDWASFRDGEGVHVLSGVQRAVRQMEEAAADLETPETKDAVEAVVAAGHAATRLAGDYVTGASPVEGDPGDLADQAKVRDGLDAALSECASASTRPT